MTITVDFSEFAQLMDLPLLEALYRIFFWYFGWLIFAWVLLWGVLQIWLYERQHAWAHKQKYVLLAIDVPRNNEQSPRSVENLFIYLAGAHGSFTLIEKWWEGKFQLDFSFEIVSIGGVIQYIIHSPAHFVHLVESAVYSQYPDAEIYEIEDYTKLVPDSFPDETYDIWGSEFVLASDWILPIRTYPEFEHQFGEPETHFRDPMSILMDLMSSLKKGEQLWYQIILVPIGQDWVKEAEAYADKMLGVAKHSSNPVDKIIDFTVKMISELSEAIYKMWGDVKEEPAKEAKAASMMELPPIKKARIEAAHRKAQKHGFEVSIRGVYIGRRDVIDKAKGVNGFVGFIKQYNTGDLNAIKPDTKQTMTSAAYFFTEQRINEKKRKIISAYKNRSSHMGVPPWILNVEELASLWHFPIDAITKAPLMQRSSGRHVEPPMALPFEEEATPAHESEPIFDEGYKIEEESYLEKKEEDIKPSPTRPLEKTKPDFLEEDEDWDDDSKEKTKEKTKENSLKEAEEEAKKETQEDLSGDDSEYKEKEEGLGEAKEKLNARFVKAKEGFEQKPNKDDEDNNYRVPTPKRPMGGGGVKGAPPGNLPFA